MLNVFCKSGRFFALNFLVPLCCFFSFMIGASDQAYADNGELEVLLFK
jgi:hypothetical protein